MGHVDYGIIGYKDELDTKGTYLYADTYLMGESS
jgi:hypothetical protein